MSSSDSRLTELEIRFSEQQQVIEDLSEMVIAQGKRIETLEKHLKLMKDKLDAVEPGLVDARANEKPPHY